MPGTNFGNIPGQSGISKIIRKIIKKGINATSITPMVRDNFNLDSMFKNEIKNIGVAI